MRLRALLLAVVWALPGIWCAGHSLSHALEPEHHGLHATFSTGVQLAGISHDHDHGHSHPDSFPVVSTEPLKKLDAAALYAANVDLDFSESTLRSYRGTAAILTSRSATAASGPRAPPIS